MNDLFCGHEIEYVRKKGRDRVSHYDVTEAYISVFAGRILKAPFLIDFDKKTSGPGSNKLYWHV